MADLLTLEECQREAVGTCTRALCDSLAPRITVSFNGRFTRALGRANPTLWTIELSKKLWPYIPVEERRDTIRHEVAHLLACHLSGSLGHDDTWRMWAKRCGARTSRTSPQNPRVSLAIEAAGILPKRKRYAAKCVCAGEQGTWWLTRQKMAQVRDQRRLACARCDTRLSPTTMEMTI